MLQQTPASESRVADVHAALDAVLDFDRPRAQDLREFFGHVGMFDRSFKRREYLLRELARAIDRAAARSLAEEIADVV
ncbi:MAG TPA: hypothetical protein VFJ06_14100 [Halococcus sp.]|nr:hypothetical protein [Halococcus sp.]